MLVFNCSVKKVSLIDSICARLEQDLNSQVIKIYDYNLPIFSPDINIDTVNLADIKAKLSVENNIIFIYPEYHGSIPAVLKNFLEWMNKNSWVNKKIMPCVFLGSNTPTSITHLINIMMKLKAIVMPHNFSFQNAAKTNIETIEYSYSYLLSQINKFIGV